MNKKKISYVVLSDIHLGHDNNKTDNIVNNLRYYFKVNHNAFKVLDVIFLAGDLFDKLLVNYSVEYLLIMEWLSELILYCKHNNIKLRVLEGTPSHDWNQAKAISTTIDKLNTDIDYKYISTLNIEHMSDLGINVLYVPDEYKHKASDTFIDVIKLLNENNLEKVDITIMHGQFNYQLPVALENSHNEEDYLNITKYYVSIGHIHSFSVYLRIIAQGSFDRLAHNEEEDKGGVLIDIYNTGDMQYRFIKNTRAKQFLTYSLTNMDIEEIRILLDSKFKLLKEQTHVRLIVDRDTNLKSILTPLKEKYINHIIKIEYVKDKEEAIVTTESNVIISFSIDRSNIEFLLTAEMEQYNLDKNKMLIFKEELSSVI